MAKHRRSKSRHICPWCGKRFSQYRWRMMNGLGIHLPGNRNQTKGQRPCFVAVPPSAPVWTVRLAKGL